MYIKFKVVGALLSLVSVVSAQNTVTLGTFGFSRSDNPVGFKISGMQFLTESNSTPSSVYGDSLPVESKIWSWNGSQYESASFVTSLDRGTGLTVTNWTSELELSLGAGHWVEFPVITEVTFSGAISEDDFITNSIITGFQICSYPYPVERVATNLGFSSRVGDKIWVWDGSGYSSSSYEASIDRGTGLTVTNWTDVTLGVGIGEGFWYEATADSQWIVERPF